MTTPEAYTLTRINEILERANEAASDLVEAAAGKAAPAGSSPEVEIMATIQAASTITKVHSVNIGALLEIVGILAREIDELRHVSS
jgi:hypothetical protein